MTPTDIEVGFDAGIATIAFNRPEKLNAARLQTTAELVAAIDAADRDDDVRVIVLTGRGRAFCAGADIGGGGDTFDYEAKRAAMADRYVEGVDTPRDGAGLVTLRIFGCRKPVIAAVNGPAMGMGATISLAADVRLASDTARFGFVFTRRGIVPEGASTWFLPRIVGVSRAAEWLFTARTVFAEEALATGLVRSVHTPDDLLPAATALAHEMAESAPVAVALTRQLLWHGIGAEHPMIAHRADSRAVQATGATADAREGISAFLEKRAPEFSGRIGDGLPDVFPGWEPPGYA